MIFSRRYGCFCLVFVRSEYRLIIKCFAYTRLTISVPVTDVQIHLQPEYQYGLSDWINCTANTIDEYTSMYLEVCLNESTFIPLENITNSTYFYIVSLSRNENCSVQKMLSHSVVFDSKLNVSLRCRVEDDYFNTSLISNCVSPNISPASGSGSLFFVLNWFQWLSLGYLFEPAKFIYLMIVAVKFQKSKSNRLTY